MTSISDLPPELLCDIAAHLHTAVDSVRFHAVCKEWRDTLRYQPPQPDLTPALLPWIIAPSTVSDDDDNTAARVLCRCVFSKTNYHPGLCVRDRRVAHADGTASWFINGLLVNPLTAKIDINRARYPWEWIDRNGFSNRIISSDGTFLVHSLSEDTDSCYAVAYHGGAAVCADLANCYIRKNQLSWLQDTHMQLPDEPGKVRRRSYLLELCGELLLASVLQDASCTDDDRLSVAVHAFDVDAAVHALDPNAAVGDPEPPAVPVWEKRDGVLGNHVLFLGFPGSFAVEAIRFGGDVAGGGAYFIVNSEPCRVYRYNFGDDGMATTLVETLPAGWNDEKCMWFLPEPDIAGSSASTKTVKLTKKQLKEVCSRRPRRRPRNLRFHVGRLSPEVDSSLLQVMFSKHGKVLQARVVRDKWGRSRGFGFVTMATLKGFDKAIAALNAKKPQQHVDPSPTKIVCTLCFLVLLLFLAYYSIASFY